jgi:hypothetical protein
MTCDSRTDWISFEEAISRRLTGNVSDDWLCSSTFCSDSGNGFAFDPFRNGAVAAHAAAMRPSAPRSSSGSRGAASSSSGASGAASQSGLAQAAQFYHPVGRQHERSSRQPAVRQPACCTVQRRAADCTPAGTTRPAPRPADHSFDGRPHPLLQRAGRPAISSTS